MKILLTGGRGFIGRNLKLNGEILSLVKNEPLEKNEVFSDLVYRAFVSEVDFKPNVIIHCAADPTTRYSFETRTQIINNILSTYNLLDCFDNCHFINISTIMILNEQGVESPSNIYSSGKLFTENLAKNFEKLKNIHVTNLRLPNVVGPNLNKGVLFDIIQKSKKSNEITLIGKEPGGYRPFIHTETINSIIDDVIKNKKYGTYNICPEDSLSAFTIVKLLEEETSKKITVNWDNNEWVGDTKYIRINSSIKVPSSLEAVRKAIKENL